MPREVTETCPPSYTLGYRVAEACWENHAPRFFGDGTDTYVLHPSVEALTRRMFGDVPEQEIGEMRNALTHRRYTCTSSGAVTVDSDGPPTDEMREYVGLVMLYVHLNFS